MPASDLYKLSDGKPVTALASFSCPTDEYRAAFADRGSVFLKHYTFEEGKTSVRTLTRGEFWDMAGGVAGYLGRLGLGDGMRIVHCFSSNTVHDAAFRLAAVLVGGTTVTVNWQSDSDETIVYKTRLTGAKVLVYDAQFQARIAAIRSELGDVTLVNAGMALGSATEVPSRPSTYDDERLIVFTSGTTGKPKGVSLSHRSYLANRLTFESYFGVSPETGLDLLLVNPLHHTNSSAILDWGMRRSGTLVHLLQLYTTLYWRVVVDVAREKRDLVIAPLVSRHFDFLDSLAGQAKLPVPEDELGAALRQVDILLGSAPVGPTTVKRVLRFSHHLPHVRFGSTETCLEVMATPTTMSQKALMAAHEAGWAHEYAGQAASGYYIGREHHPFTRVKIVKAIDAGSSNFLRPCEMGEPGYFVTQGPNVMTSYVGNDGATQEVFKDGWYVGLRDIGFALRNAGDAGLDFYWLSRDSALIIRGGANYAYEQIEDELSKMLVDEFHLGRDQFLLAVVGLRVGSEHEDSCCVTIELSPNAADTGVLSERTFIEKAQKGVAKGYRPDYVRFAPIPRNFKGAILNNELKQEFIKALRDKKIYL
jgi:acyl-CoA synthetase (AMP-forming)/AMP-acid ligase II